ncbi:MAG: ACT domain-containing protein [Vicinamibacterales bacterium]
MAIRTELNLRLQNTPGALARVCEALAQEHVNIVALSLEASGALRLIVDNHVHAAGVLRSRHHHVEERDVLFTLAPNGPGAIAGLARLLSEEGVNLEYMYTTASDSDAMSTIVAGVPDVQRASMAAGV